MDGENIKIYMQKGKMREVSQIVSIKDKGYSKGTIGLAVNNMKGVHFDGV